MELTPNHVAWRRIARSGLVEPWDRADQVAGSLLGIQSQFVPASGLAMKARLAGEFTQSDLDGLLHDSKSLVRTWGQRNTVHVYATQDWATIVAATQLLSLWQDRLVRRVGGDVPGLTDAMSRVEEILRGVDRASRAEIVAADPTVAPWFEWGTGVLMDLARRGVTCQAGLVSSRSYFAHRSVWLPNLEWSPPSTEDACVSLARRYFEAYGPATVHDLAFWFGGKIGDARRWVARLGDELMEVDVNGERLLTLAADAIDLAVDPPPRKEWPLTMLHRFDPLLLPHKDKSWIVADEKYKAVWRKAGYVEAVVLRHGRIAGTWRYDKKRSGLEVTVGLFGRIPAREAKALGWQAESVAAYFGLPLEKFEIG